jgi:hypothetical protein
MLTVGYIPITRIATRFTVRPPSSPFLQCWHRMIAERALFFTSLPIVPPYTPLQSCGLNLHTVKHATRLESSYSGTLLSCFKYDRSAYSYALAVCHVTQNFSLVREYSSLHIEISCYRVSVDFSNATPSIWCKMQSALVKLIIPQLVKILRSKALIVIHNAWPLDFNPSAGDP